MHLLNRAKQTKFVFFSIHLYSCTCIIVLFKVDMVPFCYTAVQYWRENNEKQSVGPVWGRESTSE